MRPQKPGIGFTPVRLKPRHDGWTAAKQFRFIEELAATSSITRACRAVGMSRESAYKLRDRPDARQFRLARNGALRPDLVRPRRVSTRAEVSEGGGRAKFTLDRQSTSSTSPTLEILLRRLRAGAEPPYPASR
jgi:hypothetical protein